MSPDVSLLFSFFFFNDTATTEIYTLSLHDALPIYRGNYKLLAGDAWSDHTCERRLDLDIGQRQIARYLVAQQHPYLFEKLPKRSEEHTSELQSRQYLVCRLLLEKKKNFQ